MTGRAAFVRAALGIGLLGMVCLTGGCRREADRTRKLRDIEFTVVEKSRLPEELSQMIEAEKAEDFRVTYADEGYLYIARGYGRRDTSGYSIEVAALYETENAVCIHTKLLGPSKEEKVTKSAVYPYVVVKMEWIEKNVVFD